MNQPAHLTIDIWSDVMCPWCIIGYKQLQKALAMLEGELDANIRWRPFELNRDMAPEGEDMARHMERKYGITPAEASAPSDMLADMAERAGYPMQFTGEGEAPPKRIWNTLDAHKLLLWALRECGAEAQTRLKLALFDAHFQQRRNLSDPEVLVDTAASAGLNPELAQAALLDEGLERTIREDQTEALDGGITAVPMVVVNGRYMIPGAQEPEVYRDALRRVAARS